MNRPNYVASTIYPKVLYGPDNVLGWPTSGTVQTISNVQLDDIENYYKSYFSKNDAEVIIVGDITQSEILPKLKFLETLPSNDIEMPVLKEAPKVAKTKIYFVDVPNAAQTEFRVGYVTNLKFDALGDYFKAGVMNYPLGGAFNSRLNLHLREEKGWTYGARGAFDGDKYTGDYSFGAGIKADVTDSALVDIMRIITDFRKKGVTPEELEFTKKSMGQSDARKYEAAFQKAGFLARILDYDLPASYTKDQNKLLEKLNTEEINKLAARYVPDPSSVNIVLVGDKAKLWDKLQTLGYEMQELDKNGNILKN